MAMAPPGFLSLSDEYGLLELEHLLSISKKELLRIQDQIHDEAVEFKELQADLNFAVAQRLQDEGELEQAGRTLAEMQRAIALESLLEAQLPKAILEQRERRIAAQHQMSSFKNALAACEAVCLSKKALHKVEMTEEPDSGKLASVARLASERTHKNHVRHLTLLSPLEDQEFANAESDIVEDQLRQRQPLIF
eukprot:GEMP01104656.1.p1 GENE.GEMP01104656.1~~GEMP01104656.1.p1  ORF type:complete len:193 (+),score=58.75 GEMP01104656.1:55-633(+)